MTGPTPEQARALRRAHWALAHDKDTTPVARRVDRLRAALQAVADAFPEDAS